MSSRISNFQRSSRSWRVLPAMLLTAIVVACGGGYGGNGSGYTTPTGTAAPAGVSVGAITGFGSVHLNGKKFQTSSATIKVDGHLATQAELHVGDVIEVKGHHESTTNTDVADQVELHSNVVGPVGSIDTVGQTLSVMGQHVLVSAGTSFDSGISPASLAGITVGDILRVSGMPAATGDIQATRIERKPAGTTLRVIGTAAATDGTAKRLMINALSVDFSAASLSDFPSSGPKDGDLVEASGTMLGAAGELKATKLELRSATELKAEAHGSSEIEGLVTRFASSSDFDVAGRPVSTSSSTAFEGGAAGDLALNVRVEVEGAIDSAGVLAATKVSLERSADSTVLAQADAVDPVAGTVTALGIQITVNAMTRFEDRSSQHVDTFSLANVHTGDWVEVRGSESPAGSNAILAARFERRDAQSSARIGGVVKTAAPPALTILSVSIATTPSTHFNDASNSSTSAAAFFTGLVGRRATVVGSWNGTVFTAQDASLGHDEGD